jgi:hypothetical protein
MVRRTTTISGRIIGSILSKKNHPIELKSVKKCNNCDKKLRVWGMGCGVWGIMN